MTRTAARFSLLVAVLFVFACGGDDDAPMGTPGVTVTPTTGLRTSERGMQAMFSVVLDAQPTADVTIALSSSNTAEGTVSPASLTFTSMNWNAPQNVTATGVDDTVADGDVVYTIVTAQTASDDARYMGIDPDDVSVTNDDDETAGVTVTPTTGLVTTEMGGTATFTIVLDAAPSADVTIALSSSDDTEGTVSPAMVTFTPENFAAPQTVTVTGVDDTDIDGDVMFMVATAQATSTDPNYSSLDAADVEVTNTDDETAGVTVMPTSGLMTTEAGGTATFTVVLNSEPTADVTIDLTTSDDTEGTPSPASLTFTMSNFAAPQTVTITGVNDDVMDGDQPYMILTGAASSADTGYDGFDAADVSVTNVDDDAPGITVTPTSGLETREDGTTATFTIVLNSQPTADVTVEVESTDTGEGTVDPVSITFTSVNWNAPQTITATGVNDDLADGDQPYMVRTRPALSTDPGYSGRDAMDVSLTNLDDDSPGVIVTPTSGLMTTEAGGTATFTIVLRTMPAADVSFTVESSDTGEATVSPTTVTFTPVNWNAPQTVTAEGVNDTIVDGDQPFTIRVLASVSTDPDYDGTVDPDDPTGVNVDDDSPGFTVTPTTGLVTTEGGGTATFTVVLTSEPTADVSFDVTSSDTTEGDVSTAALTFTTVNWNAPQMVTITGLPDSIFDGDQPYTIVTSAATSADPLYEGRDPANVTVVNEDSDPGVAISPTSGLVTTEGGGTATFTVVLNTMPSAGVTLSIASGDMGEGTVGPTSVTFTTANWDAPQTVTVTGVNDAIADGDQPYTIVTGATVSTDLSYNGLTVVDVSVTNEDDETAGFIIRDSADLTVTEAGASDTFTIRLRSQPTADVTVPLVSSDMTEGTVSPSMLTFTSLNWASPQVVTISGVDDFLADGNQVFEARIQPVMSGDPGYDGRNPPNLPVTCIDDETAGFIVAPRNVVTREDGTLNPQFAVRLTSEPTADVTINVSSGDTSEGLPSPTMLTFTSLNWNADQFITVTGEEDTVADGDQPYTIVLEPAMSADASYDGLDPADVAALNVDNDSAGITLTAAPGLTTTEAGGVATFTLVLNSEPTANVRITVDSLDPSEAIVTPFNTNFTPLNWNAPRTVTITGVDDFVQDGDIMYVVRTRPAVSADPNYDGLNAPDLDVVNIDDETAGFTVTPTAGLSVNESGTTDTFGIRLNSQPTANVTVTLTSSDLGEASASPSMVVFTPMNWDAVQTVTVMGEDDSVQDGTQGFIILTGAASSADPNYAGRNPADVTGSCVDDDSAGVTVNAAPNLRSTEIGGSATFTIRLNSQPTADVTLSLMSSNTLEGTVTPAGGLTFTTLNWNAPQTVRATGVDDFVADGNQLYTIITGDTVSADGDYAGLVVPDVNVTNVDNETASISVSRTSGLVTNESGTASDTFTVVLTSQPTASVTVPLMVDDTTEASVTTSVTFTTANWSTPRTVTVMGVNDPAADGNQSFNVIVGPATSGDPNYMGLTGSSVAGTNLDDETPGIRVTPTSGLITSESGTPDTFDVVLNSQPFGNVVIALSGNPSEGTLSTMMLTFTMGNWDTVQTVTVTGVDDAIADGNQLYFVVGNPSGSSDPAYAALTPFTVQVTNTDND